jgi:hypothetical protein
MCMNAQPPLSLAPSPDVDPVAHLDATPGCTTLWCMAKTAVYSWRVAPETLADLEQEARRTGASVAAVLDELTREWLEVRRKEQQGDEDEQARLRAAVMKTIGTVSGGNPQRSEQARTAVRARLTRRRAC